jgi:hypothetical protein
MNTPQPRFQIGDRVKAVAFTDCLGKPVPEYHGLTVTSVRLIETPVNPHDTNPLKPYYRIVAEGPVSPVYVEGAERFFDFDHAMSPKDALTFEVNHRGL